MKISHLIFFWFRFAQTWKDTHWKVIYVWSSQCVIITICEHHSMWTSRYVNIKASGSKPSYEITSSVCFYHTYLWSPMILSGYDQCNIPNQNNCDHYTNACDHTKCDHILWSYNDVNKTIGSCRHKKIRQILSCSLVTGFRNEVIIKLVFPSCFFYSTLHYSAFALFWQYFAKFAYLSKALYKYIYLRMSIKIIYSSINHKDVAYL